MVCITGRTPFVSARPLAGVSSAKSWHRLAAAWWRAWGQVIREPRPETAASQPRRPGDQGKCASLVVPPPAREFRAARTAVNELHRGSGHALGGGAAGGLA